MPFCAWELYAIGGRIKYSGYWKEMIVLLETRLRVSKYMITCWGDQKWQLIPPLAIILINNAFITSLSQKWFLVIF